MSKVKSPSNHTEESLDWGERMLQHPAFEWVVENSKYLPYVFLALLAIIALGYKLTNGSAVEAEANFQLAEGYQSQILASLGEEDGQAKQTEALSRLREIVGDY